jgi:hypothetical protein
MFKHIKLNVILLRIMIYFHTWIRFSHIRLEHILRYWKTGVDYNRTVHFSSFAPISSSSPSKSLCSLRADTWSYCLCSTQQISCYHLKNTAVSLGFKYLLSEVGSVGRKLDLSERSGTEWASLRSIVMPMLIKRLDTWRNRSLANYRLTG